MLATDWNWFFSSLSQSTAAIVGLIGAFIVSKVLTNQSAFAEKQRKAQDLISSAKQVREKAKLLSFAWYHRHTNADAIDRLQKMFEEDSTLDAESAYERLSLSPYISKASAIGNLRNGLDDNRRRVEAERAAAQAEAERTRAIGGFAAMRPSMSSADFLTNASLLAHLQPQLNAERDRIDNVYTEARHHSLIVTDLHRLLIGNPESSNAISAALVMIALLFFAGVIYPLSFMPLPPLWTPRVSVLEIPRFLFSFRGILLAFVSLVFVAMLRMFFEMNRRLKYSPATVADLAAYESVGAYSEYFTNREENDARRDALHT